MTKTRAGLLAVICAILAFGTGFYFGGGGTATQNGTIVVAGSTSIAPLMETFGKEYAVENPDVKVETNANGSSAGIQAAIDGTADIGMSSRELKPEEVQAAEDAGLTVAPIALDGIAVIVNPNNPVQDLTTEQVNAIYTGEITNWSELGGADEEINVYSRETGSGTRDAFEAIFDISEEDPMKPGVTEQASSGAIMTAIAQDPAAIGYVSMGSVNDQVAAAAIDGVEPSIEDVQNGTYKVYRTFYLVYDENNDLVKEFTDWIFGETGQAIIEEEFILLK